MDKTYVEKIVSSDVNNQVKILWILYKEQPLTITEMTDRLQVNRKTINDNVEKLKDANILKNITENPRKGVTFVYALWNYSGIVEVYRKMNELNRKKIALFQLGRKVGKPPEEIKKDAYKLADQYDIDIVPADQADPSLMVVLRGPRIRPDEYYE